MKVFNMSCPHCQNGLEVPEDVSRLNCSHCGTELIVQQGKGFMTLKAVNESEEADDKQSEKVAPPTVDKESEKVVRQPPDADEQERIRRNNIIIISGFVALCISTCIFFAAIGNSDESSPEPAANEQIAARSEETDTPETTLESASAPEQESEVSSTAAKSSMATKSATATKAPTATASATPTQEPTQTPAPDALAVVQTNANLRSGPGSNFDVIDSAEAGEELEVFGRNDDGTWVKVDRAGEHWIWVNLVELSADIDEITVPPSPTPTLTPTITKTPTATPSPNATATNEALSEAATATHEAFAEAATATHEASSKAATAIAEKQSVIDATATVEAYVTSPPVGSWCSQNSRRGVCVGNFDYRQSIQYSRAPANGRFIAFTTLVKNLSGSSMYVNPHDVTLVLEDGTTYAHDTATYYFSDFFNAVTIASGDNAQGTVVFLVKNDVAPERIIYQGGGFFESDVMINLKDEPRPEEE